ncbi:uncharacterized protein LOC131667252 [Phymastichus coffea]|uniref:uncharacterized protein LOC131667252 n=1 Tax=Phymastichus coffea TaxID=108790 RepID=UPI00273B20BC|nr:uncharacterized protein LOC131667252 [Phymastichus coffea]
MKLVALLFALFTCECCRDINPRRAIIYSRVKKDAQSMESVILRRRLTNVDECRDLAESKYALAFNFARLPSNNSDEITNCVLLHCPETSGFRQLLNVTGIDYYSAYSRRAYSGNHTLTCVRSVGLFAINFQKQNFSNARNECQKNKSFLADVVGDERTTGLGNLIGQFTVYVGLSNEGQRRIWKNEFGEALACQDYRAWGMGEPSHSRGCVALFRLHPKADPVWKVVSCAIELPYICEIPRLTDTMYLNRTLS